MPTNIRISASLFILLGFFISLHAQPAVQVFLMDEGFDETNIVKPRIYIVNTGTVSISDFYYLYHCTAENGLTPVAEDWYTPNADMSLHEIGDGNFVVRYDFTGVTLDPGQTLPDESGNVIGIHYSDWSAFDKSNDFSYAANADFAVNNNIPVYDAMGNLISGNEGPDFDFPTQTTPVALNIVEQFLVFGKQKTDLKDRVSVLGGAVASDAYVELGADSETHSDVLSGGDAFLRERALVDADVAVAGLLDTQNDVQITGTTIEGATHVFSDVPTKPNIPVGTDDLTVQNNETQAITPGTYKDVHIFSGATVTFSSGVYNLRKLIIEPDVQVLFDLLGDDLELNVVEELRIADRTMMDFTGNIRPIGVKIHTEQTVDLFLGTDSRLYGIISAPNANVSLYSRSTLVGTIYGKQVTVEPDVQMCYPTSITDISHSEGAYGPGFSPFTSTYQAVIPSTVASVTVEARPTDNATTISINGNASRADITILPPLTTVTIEVVNSGKEHFLEHCGTTTYELTLLSEQNYSIRVNDDSPASEGSEDGLSWATAFKSLQDALDVAQEQGKEIWVAEGTYLPEMLLDMDDPRSATFVLKPGHELRGGFEGLETETPEEREGLIHTTILSGDLFENDELVTVPNETLAENAYHVLVLTGNSSKGIYIDRVSVSGGYASGIGNHEKGGGVLTMGGSGVIKESAILNNFSEGSGAGLFVANGNTFELLNSMIFLNQSFNGDGGGISLNNASGILFNSVLAENSAESGGAVTSNNSTYHLAHSTFSQNHSQLGGSAIANNNSGQIQVQNVIFWNNSTTTGKVIQNIDSDPLIQNSNVQDALATGSWDEDLGVDGGGNISEDPLFVNLDAAGEDGDLFTVDDGLQLSVNSPSIDKGLAIADDKLETDMFGIDRPFGLLPDQGAYEFFSLGDGEIEFGKISARTHEFAPSTRFFVHTFSELTVKNVEFAAYSSDGYAIKVKTAKNKHLKDSFYGQVRTFADGSLFSNGVRVTFYKIGEEGSQLIYASRRGNGTRFVDGKPLIFVQDKSFESATNPIAYLIHGATGAEEMRLQIEVPHNQF